jgi:predicted transport protein
MPKLYKPERINLLNNPTIKESWIQEQIANDPSILGLGDLALKDKERIQPRAGRLDLLLQDLDSKRRYEVEVQLGKSDESHIIRTLEYWDIEKKRFPQYDHCAVIIAEDITTRFLNVIKLFNSSIPFIAIQMSAFKYGEDIALIFTKVLDESPLGLVDEDEEVRELTDRDYWIKRGTIDTVVLADEMLEVIKGFYSGFELNYTKSYIGLAKDGQSNNFVIFRPRKKDLNLEIKLPQSDEVQKIIDESNLDDMGYDTRWSNYRIRVSKQDLKKNKEAYILLLNMAFQNYEK